MTVHARGYRAYEGRFAGAPAWWVILSTALRTTLAGKGVRFLGVLLLLWFVLLAVPLYLEIGLAQGAEERLRFHGELTFPDLSRRLLLTVLTTFYTGVAGLMSLLAIFSGAGVVADDLQARALTLYLVRPIRAFDYALGKGLLVPTVLLLFTALPGAAYWLLVGAWQAPGFASEFWRHNLDVLGLIGRFVLVAGASFSGLVLLLSASTPRRGVVSALAAAALFGGTMLQGIGAHLRGTAGEMLRLLGLPFDALVPLFRAAFEQESLHHGSGHLEDLESRWPDPTAAAVLAGALLAAGLLRTWIRARSVEVSE